MSSFENGEGGENRDKFEQSVSARNLDKHEADKFDIFNAWLLENGAQIPKLELKDYGNEVRGCHTKEDIVEDEIIIEIPLKCLITVEMGKETKVGQAILRSNVELDAPKHIFLMVFMLIDRKNPNSFFKPYYDILPPTLNNMPIFWNQEELKYLEGSYLLEQIDERNEAIKADYDAICDLCPEFADVCNLNEFKWARMCVCSRNFGLLVNGVQTAALVPYADMLNHYRPRETKWQFDDELQGFTVISLQGISSGSQVYDSYGRKCNHRFLLNYGFSVENNVEVDGFCPNEVPFLLQMNQNDPLLEAKVSYYRRDLTSPYKRIRVCVSDNENTKLMFAMLRIIEADRADIDLLISTAGGSTLYRSIRDAQVAISLKNEIRAMTLLLSMCKSMLEAYPTSYDEDCERLAHGNLQPFSNERHAVIQVKGEKEVLLFFVEFATIALQMLQVRDGDQFEALLESVRVLKDPLIFQYCRGTVGRLLHDDMRRQLDHRSRNMDLTRPTIV